MYCRPFSLSCKHGNHSMRSYNNYNKFSCWYSVFTYQNKFQEDRQLWFWCRTILDLSEIANIQNLWKEQQFIFCLGEMFCWFFYKKYSVLINISYYLFFGDHFAHVIRSALKSWSSSHVATPFLLLLSMKSLNESIQILTQWRQS